MIKLPGLIDPHVHLRDPGQTDKEDFYSGSMAALAGGFTTVVDMPNNSEPIISVESLKNKIRLAEEKSVVNMGFHFGSLGDNFDQFEEAASLSLGLKLYLNNTTGGYMLDPKNLKKIYAAWPEHRPVLLHAEEDVIEVAIESLEGLQRPIHICHMPSKFILEKILEAKKAGLPVTCGVTPHHLYLSDKDAERIGPFAQMKPSLKPQADLDYLWEHFDDIDIVESDHAPHTVADKQAGAFGVPGLETTLSLLLSSYKKGNITLDQVIDKCHQRPAEIFSIPTTEDTYLEVSEEEFNFDASQFKSKAKWSPFNEMAVYGQVTKVVIEGETKLENGKIVAERGSGRVIA